MQACKCAQALNLSGILLHGVWLLALLAAVVAVPTSVLVQNSELSSNLKAAAAKSNAGGPSGNNNNNHNNSNKLFNNMLPANSNNNYNNAKVKRSSSNAKESMSANNAAAAAGLDKKSSPEIVPASFNAPPQAQQQSSDDAAADSSGMIALPSNGDIINSAIAAGLTAAALEAAAAATQREYEQQQQQQSQLYGDEAYGARAGEDTPTLMYKRGITPQQYLYGSGAAVDAGSYGNFGNYGNSDYYNNNPYYTPAAAQTSAGLTNVPNGMWADELDAGYPAYNELQDPEEYAPAPRAASYRNKAYDNLQNLLNSEAYLEPVVLPVQYAGRYYGVNDAERNKRASKLNNYNNKLADMRLKRDSKLTPADMLALVALVEAGERARKDTDADVGYPMYQAAAAAPATVVDERERYNPKNYYASAYDYPVTMDDVDYNGGAWLEPAMVDYYGMPVNLETLPKYELTREHKYGANSGNNGGNRMPGKRFMVSKKKRSLGKPSISYNPTGDKYF